MNTKELQESWTEDLIRKAARNLVEIGKTLTYEEAEAFVRTVVKAHREIINDPAFRDEVTINPGVEGRTQVLSRIKR